MQAKPSRKKQTTPKVVGEGIEPYYFSVSFNFGQNCDHLMGFNAVFNGVLIVSAKNIRVAFDADYPMQNEHSVFSSIENNVVFFYILFYRGKANPILAAANKGIHAFPKGGKTEGFPSLYALRNQRIEGFKGDFSFSL